MNIRLKSNSYLIFDLDDTLYPEINFLRSGYKEVGRFLHLYLQKDISEEMFIRYISGKNVFEWIIQEYKQQVPELSIQFLLALYREHYPEINLSDEVKLFLEKLRSFNTSVGCITDGRSITQRNKIAALGLTNFFNEVIISEEFGSEKPNRKNYEYFSQKYPDAEFFFIGDNTSKDFIVPNEIGWKTICIKDKGENIHKQSFNSDSPPHFIISSFEEIKLIK